MTYISYSATRSWWLTTAYRLKWSALRRVGNLPLMRAVMFAPVIGYLIIFNDYVFGFLKQVFINAGVHPHEDVSVANIYFLYYGLICVGVASILYALSCPASIVRFADSTSFAREALDTRAKTIIMAYFDYIIAKLIANENRHNHDEKETADYPEDIRCLTCEIVVEIYKRYLEKERLSEEALTENSQEQTYDNERWCEFHRRFSTGSGYFVPEEIAKAVYEPPKALWSFTEPYRAIAAEVYAADIAVAKYEVDDYSRFALRLLTAFLYLIGFILLFIPSARTFMSISVMMLRTAFW